MSEKCTECGGSTEDVKEVNVLGKPIGCRACGATGSRAEQERRIRIVFDPANDGKTVGELRAMIESTTPQVRSPQISLEWPMQVRIPESETEKKT